MKKTMMAVVALLLVSTVSAETYLERRATWLFGPEETFLVLPDFQGYLVPSENGFTVWEDRVFGDVHVGYVYDLTHSYTVVLQNGMTQFAGLLDHQKLDDSYVTLFQSSGRSPDIELYQVVIDPSQIDGVVVTGVGNFIGYESPELGHLDWVDSNIYKDAQGTLYEAFPGNPTKVRNVE